MRIIIIILACVAVGIGIGWRLGHTSTNGHDANSVREELAADESGHAVAAMFAAEAVKYIDAGDIQQAVETLSFPIASYYSVYAVHAGTNAERLKVRGYIEHFASTNPIVAARITKEMSY
jgi:hypothetical protein